MKRRLLGTLAALAALIAWAGCSAEAQRERMLERGGKYFAAGDYEKAKVTYLNVLQELPSSAIVHERLGAIWLEQGSPMRALPHLEQAKEFSPGDPAIRTRLAAAYVAIERIADARREALVAARATAAYGDALLILSETIRSRADYDLTLTELKKSPVRNLPTGILALTNLLLLKGDVEQAEKLVTGALKRQPDASALHAALGAIRLRQGDQKQAGEALQQAAELSPAHSAARLRYAEFLVRSETIDRAKAYLQEMLRAAPDYLPARRELANLLIREKAFSAAEEQIRTMLYQDTTNIDGYLLLANIHLAKGEGPAAIVRLAKLLDEHPTLPLLSYRLAWALAQDGELDRAASVVQAGLRHDPSHLDSLLLLAELHLRDKRADAAVQVLVGLLNDYPQHSRAQTMLADGLHALGRLDEAAVVLRERLRAEPDSVSANVLLGRLLLEQGKPGEARDRLTAALQAAPANEAAVTALVELEVRSGNHAAALQCTRAAQDKAPDSALFRSIEASIHLAMRRWSDAELALRQALHADPHNDRSYNLLKIAYDARKLASGVMPVLDELLARNPQNARALLLKAIVHAERKEFADAQGAYERLLALKPDSAVPLNNLAALYAEEPAQIERAFVLASKARALDPESPMIADTLGWVLYQRQDYTGALELIEEAAKKLPDNPEIQFHLAMVNVGLARTEAARTAFEQAARAIVDFPGKAEIAARLSKLKQGSASPALK